MNAPQGSEAWLQERCGMPTASEFSSVLAKGQGLTRKKYLRRVVAECLTGRPIDSAAYGGWQQNLERGQEQEQAARTSYETITGNIVEQVGFVKHPMLRSGCSPDGFIGSDGGCEIKCVIPTVQIETILSGTYPTEHKAQIQGSLWITGRKWWDFCSYSPDLPEHLATYIFRVTRDEDYIKTLNQEVILFLVEMDSLIDTLNGRKAA